MGSIKGEEIINEVNEKIYVAVSKEWKACKSSVEWTIRNAKGKRLCLVHVHQPTQYISILGGKFPVSSLSEQEVALHRETERQEMCKLLDEYIRICTKARVQVEKLYIENETIESGLVELISQYKIERLVMGAAADKSYSRKMMEPKSKKANYVRQHAPVFCHIWFVCKARLIYTREGIKQSQSKGVDQPRLTNAKPRLTNVTSELSTTSSPNRLDSRTSFDRSSTFSLSQLSFFSQFSEVTSDASSYASVTEDREPSFRSFALPPRPEEKQLLASSPNSLDQEENTNEVLYNQLDQAMVEVETAKREAFEESMRRRKAEKDAFEAICKGNAAELLYYDEMKRRKDVEEELLKTKRELERTKKQRDTALEELQEAINQKFLLSSRAEKSEVMGKELEEKITSALEMLQSFR